MTDNRTPRQRLLRSLNHLARRYAQSGFDADYLNTLSDENLQKYLEYMELYYNARPEGQSLERKREANRRRRHSRVADALTVGEIVSFGENDPSLVDDLDPEKLLLMKERARRKFR